MIETHVSIEEASKELDKVAAKVLRDGASIMRLSRLLTLAACERTPLDKALEQMRRYVKCGQSRMDEVKATIGDLYTMQPDEWRERQGERDRKRERRKASDEASSKRWNEEAHKPGGYLHEANSKDAARCIIQLTMAIGAAKSRSPEEAAKITEALGRCVRGTAWAELAGLLKSRNHSEVIDEIVTAAVGGEASSKALKKEGNVVYLDDPSPETVH